MDTTTLLKLVMQMLHAVLF